MRAVTAVPMTDAAPWAQPFDVGSPSAEPNTLAVLLVIMALYFLPILVAVLRKHHQLAPIVVVNVFLGWTYFGWVIALAWAVSHRESSDSPPRTVLIPTQGQPAADAPQTRRSGSHAAVPPPLSSHQPY
jgi:hypothetical protein